MRKKKEIKPLNKGTAIVAIIFLIIVVLVLTSIYISMRGNTKDVDKFRNAILALMENVIDYDVKDEYILINFPDKEELITKNGKIKSSTGKKYKEFKEGYVIKYKDGTYAFKISDGTFCGMKNYNDTGVEIDIFEPCINYDVIYRENEK